jgi:hypothetical protein
MHIFRINVYMYLISLRKVPFRRFVACISRLKVQVSFEHIFLDSFLKEIYLCKLLRIFITFTTCSGSIVVGEKPSSRFP